MNHSTHYYQYQNPMSDLKPFVLLRLIGMLPAFSIFIFIFLFCPFEIDITLTAAVITSLITYIAFISFVGIITNHIIQLKEIKQHELTEIALELAQEDIDAQYEINPNQDYKVTSLATWSTIIRQRDGKCLFCNKKAKLDAHHILPKAKYPSEKFNIKNGVAVCREHHLAAARLFKKIEQLANITPKEEV